MELSDYLRVFRKFWVSIVAVSLVVLAGAAVATIVATPTYTSRASLFLTVENGDTASDLNSGSSYTERQVKSFAQVAEAPIVLQPVIDELALATTPAALANRLTVSVPTNTSILDLAVVDTDPQRAAATAEGIAEQLVLTVAEMAPKNTAGQANVMANVISPATVPTSWTTPKVAQNLALGALLGLLLGTGQALLRHVLDRKVRTAEDVALVTDAPVVGTIAFDENAPAHPLVVLEDPHSSRAEDYRRLRTNLQFLGVGSRGRVLAVSSSVSGEGKTSTCLNVALALAAAGKRVLLVDADLRRPTIARRLNLEGAVGLTTILIGRATLEEVVQPVGEGLEVLAAGQTPPNPSELLGSDGMRELITGAGSSYDYVILDTAPLVPVADTAVLSSLVGGVLVVVASGAVDGDQLADAVASVRAADGEVVGIVLNKLKSEDVGYRSSYYYRREGYRETEPEPRTDIPQTDAVPRRQAASPAVPAN